MRNNLIGLQLKELCFEITNDCLLQCCFCSTFNDKDKKVSSNYIPKKVFKNVIEDFCELGGKVLEISGGEPLLHPEIENLIYIAKEKGLQVRLYTSGVTPLDPLPLVKKLVEAGLDRIIFNCQGLALVHDTLTGKKGAFKQMVNFLLASKKAGLWTGIHFIPMRFNISQIDFLYKLLNKIRVNEFAFLRLVKQGRASLNWNLISPGKKDYEQLSKTLSRLVKLQSVQKGLKLRLGCPFQPFKVQKEILNDENKLLCCHAGKESLNILPNGDVIPCPAFKDIIQARAGNIFKDSLKKIWEENSFLWKLRQPYLIPSCSTCKFWVECRGGCSAQRIITYGKLDKGPDPLCKLLFSRDKTEQAILSATN